MISIARVMWVMWDAILPMKAAVAYLFFFF